MSNPDTVTLNKLAARWQRQERERELFEQQMAKRRRQRERFRQKMEKRAERGVVARRYKRAIAKARSLYRQGMRPIDIAEETGLTSRAVERHTRDISYGRPKITCRLKNGRIASHGRNDA
jgi:hypothetical protein